MYMLQKMQFKADLKHLCEQQLAALKKNPLKWYNPFYWAYIKNLQRYLSDTGGLRDSEPQEYLYGIQTSKQQNQT
jgi:hypothetical protein